MALRRYLPREARSHSFLSCTSVGSVEFLTLVANCIICRALRSPMGWGSSTPCAVLLPSGRRREGSVLAMSPGRIRRVLGTSLEPCSGSFLIWCGRSFWCGDCGWFLIWCGDCTCGWFWCGVVDGSSSYKHNNYTSNKKHFMKNVKECRDVIVKKVW